MRYLLVVGFACEVYRKEPQARIFVGDRLVDEFSIPHSPSSVYPALCELKKKFHPLQPFARAPIYDRWMKNHPPLKFYELEIDGKITNLSLRIDMHNHDSNYTNGYMTRSTLIRLEACAFFPLHPELLLRLQKIKARGLISKNYAWYRTYKNFVFDLVQNGMCWQEANGLNITNTSVHTIGGDGVFVCELTKKYGILMPTLARACRHHFSLLVTNYLLDKYQQHAHQ